MAGEQRPQRSPAVGPPPSAPPDCGCPRDCAAEEELETSVLEERDGKRLIQVGFKGHRLELCLLPDEIEPSIGLYVIVEADRGVDIGMIVRCDRGLLAPYRKRPTRKIIRTATEKEIEHLTHIRREEISALTTCRQRVEAFKLPMQTVDAEYQFDGNRVTFYFTAEGRVDFRALVRDLAKIFRTRIELRQINPRESARRQGGVGPCGRSLCCAAFLQAFEPVTLKMAKQQNLALSPQRISGVCGRLLCCLGYSNDCPSPHEEDTP